MRKEKKKQSARLRAFLAAFSQTGCVIRSAEHAKMHRSLHYRALERSAAYRELFSQAERAWADALEGHAMYLAKNGVLEPVYQGSKLAGHKLKFSTALILGTLKAVKPEKYRDRVQQDVNNSGQIEVIVRSVLDPEPE